jgi:hypothetical protein
MPSPNLTPPRVAADQILVDVLYSPSQHERAIITRDANGTTYRIRTEYWRTDDRGPAFWCVPRYTAATLTNTAELAQQFARDRLHELIHNIPKNA